MLGTLHLVGQNHSTSLRHVDKDWVLLEKVFPRPSRQTLTQISSWWLVEFLSSLQHLLSLNFHPEELGYRFWICQWTPQVKRSSINQLMINHWSCSLPSISLTLPPCHLSPSPSEYICVCIYYRKHKHQRFYKWPRVDNERKGFL